MSQFLAEHEYNVELVGQVEPPLPSTKPTKRAKRLIERIREAEELARDAMTSSKHKIEEYVNRKICKRKSLKKETVFGSS